MRVNLRTRVCNVKIYDDFAVRTPGSGNTYQGGALDGGTVEASPRSLYCKTVLYCEGR